jgi:hypothetical protein
LPLPEAPSAAGSRCWLKTCRGRVSSSTIARTKCFNNPFLFIRGLSCPVPTQCSDIIISKLSLPGFPYNLFPVSCGNIGFKKNPRSSIGLEVRPQSICAAFRAFLPFCCTFLKFEACPASSNSKKWTKLPLLFAAI